MKSALLLVALFCICMFPSGASAQLTACCSITAIDAATAIVSAKVNSSGAGFQFKVTDAKSLERLRLSQGIYANRTTKQVSLDGQSVCCMMIGAPQVPVASPAPKAGLPPSTTTSVVTNVPQTSRPTSATKSFLVATPGTATVVPQTSTPTRAIAVLPPLHQHGRNRLWIFRIAARLAASS